jgi:multiple sugar transport system ATP-binding protein
MIHVTHDQTEALTLGDRVVVLRDGMVQQAATPADLCNHPSNRFVASFIGWPAMNFLDGHLEGAEFVTPLDRLRLSPQLAERWSVFRERELTIGIRPERLSLTDGPEVSATTPQAGAPAAGVWECETVWMEAAGAATVVELERHDTHLTLWTVRQPRPQLRQKVSVVIEMDQAHLFDRITGEALCHPGTA